MDIACCVINFLLDGPKIAVVVMILMLLAQAEPCYVCCVNTYQLRHMYAHIRTQISK